MPPYGESWLVVPYMPSLGLNNELWFGWGQRKEFNMHYATAEVGPKAIRRKHQLGGRRAAPAIMCEHPEGVLGLSFLRRLLRHV